MKLRHAVLLPVLLALFGTAQAQDKGTGLGFILGEPSGISMKFWLDQEHAVDLGVAWAFSDNGSFHIHGDYLWHQPNWIKVNSGRMPVYYGVGARARLGDHTRIGIRGVIGLAYWFESTPLEIFMEIAPVFDLIDETDFGVNGGIGVRYYI